MKLWTGAALTILLAFGLGFLAAGDSDSPETSDAPPAEDTVGNDASTSVLGAQETPDATGGSVDEAGDSETDLPQAEELVDLVRRFVVLEDEPLRSQLAIDSDEALAAFVASSPAGVGSAARTGDYYLIFADKQVLFRPESQQVVLAVPVAISLPLAENNE